MITWLDKAFFYGPYYSLCTSDKSFRKELKRNGVPKSEIPHYLNEHADATVHYFTTEKGLICIVCIDDSSWKRKKSEVMGLLVHEASHIFDETMKHLGEKDPSKEFKAYSLQNISQNLYDAFLKIRKKRKK